MSSLVITKESGNIFKFELDGGTPIRNDQNRLLTNGDYCNFKTANGASIVQKQNILFSDVTIVDGSPFVPTTIQELWTELIAVGFFNGVAITGGGSGATSFTELLDAFNSYLGRAGQIVVVNDSETGLTTISYDVFTAEDRAKLDGIETGAQVNVTPDWSITNPATPGYIAGKPSPYGNLTSVGSFHYADTTTSATPIVVLPNTDVKLTNDAQGEFTISDNAPYGVTSLWNDTLNQFDFSELSVGDQLSFRPNISITTTVANQKYNLYVKFGIGSISEFILPFAKGQIKTASENEFTFLTKFDIAYEDTLNYPAEVYFLSDDDAEVKIIGWYIEVIRKNINVVNVTEFTKLSEFENDIPLAEQSEVDSIEDRVTVLENFNPPPQSGFTGLPIAVWSGVGLIYNYVFPSYYLEGVEYPAISGNITLTAADPTYPRFTSIIADSSGVNEVLGVAQVNPPTPSLDPNTQLFVINVLINAGETTPADVSQSIIYDEGTEWTTYANHGNITFNNTTDPLNGTYCINVADSVNGTYLELTAPVNQNIVDANGLGLWIKLVNAIAPNRGFTIALYQDSNKVSDDISFKRFNNVGTAYGLEYSNTTDWQLVVIPYQDFNFSNPTFNKLRITFISTVSLKMDYLRLISSSSIGATPDKKGFSKIITDDGIANATSSEDTLELVGVNGTIVEAVGKKITIDTQALIDADAGVLQDAKDYTDTGLALKLDASAYNDRFKGKFLTEAAMRAAYPTANVGDEAQVNEVGSETVKNFLWDDELNDWVQSGSGGSGATNTDALPEGSTNLYFTTARVLATVLAGLSATAGTFTSSDSLLTAFGKIKYLIDNIATTYQVIITDVNFGSFINGLTSKTTPVDADIFSYVDTEDSNKLKKFTWANIKTALATLFTVKDRLLENATVSGSFALDYSLYELWNLTLTGATTFTESNLERKTILIRVTGNFALTFPSGWSTYINGSYVGTQNNRILVQYIKTGIYEVSITQPD